MNDQNAEAIRLSKQAEILTRLEDMISEEPVAMSVYMVNAALQVLTKEFPATLDRTARAKIASNYPDVTNELVKERAMAMPGALTAIRIASQMARIAVDYQPESHFSDVMEKDMALGAAVNEQGAVQLRHAYARVAALGVSDFGVSTMAILHAVALGREQGIPPLMLVRSLLDAINMVVDGEMSGRTQASEEEILDFYQKQMGISRATAKKHLKAAKDSQGA